MISNKSKSTLNAPVYEENFIYTNREDFNFITYSDLFTQKILTEVLICAKGSQEIWYVSFGGQRFSITLQLIQAVM